VIFRQPTLDAFHFLQLSLYRCAAVFLSSAQPERPYGQDGRANSATYEQCEYHFHIWLDALNRPPGYTRRLTVLGLTEFLASGSWLLPY
jgi:hypothetical protein